MRYENTHQSVILLLDGNTSADNKFIKNWFQESRFLTSEATDIFQALEEIADFTTPQRPQVILLEVLSIPDDFQTIKRVTQTFAGHTGLPIFAFSENGKIVNDRECFEGNLAQLTEKLDGLIPIFNKTRQAAAI
jgi:hypothetical protein